MFSDKENILYLTATLIANGISDVVVCPGSRNAPIVHTFAEAGMKCYEVTDERSAGFFAIGLIDSLCRPVAVCVTSGSAVLNVYPAVCEAFYRHVPLIVISADRPEIWIGQMDGQTLPQQNVFGSMVVRSVQLPQLSDFDGVFSDDEETWYCKRLINEAMIEQKRCSRPIHINVPIDEPLFNFTSTALPHIKTVSYDGNRFASYSFSREMIEEWNSSINRMIIVGQLTPKDGLAITPIIESLIDRGITVICEALSNIHCHKRFTNNNSDTVLHVWNNDETLVPHLITYIGGHIVSKRLKKFIRNNKPQNNWLVNPYGEMSDLFCSLTRYIELPATTFLNALQREVLNNISGNNHGFASRWSECDNAVTKFIDSYSFNSFSDLALVKTFLSKIPRNWALHVANSSSIRNIQLFLKSDNMNNVYCNRGVNGIDGSLSTAAGFAASGKDVCLIIGDLSFFYDQNGLWNNFCRDNNKAGRLHILIINNGGGQIFHNLSGLEASPHRDKYVAGIHHTKAEGAALECGALYLTASSLKELDAATTIMFSSHKKTVILEAFTDSKNDDATYKDFYEGIKTIKE